MRGVQGKAVSLLLVSHFNAFSASVVLIGMCRSSEGQLKTTWNERQRFHSPYLTTSKMDLGIFHWISTCISYLSPT